MTTKHFRLTRGTLALGLSAALFACGSEDDASDRDASLGSVVNASPEAGVTSQSANPGGDAAVSIPPAQEAGAAPSMFDAGGQPPAQPEAGTTKPMTTVDAGSTGGPTGAMGPDDGDPSKPVVALPDVPCGGPKGGFGLGTANLKVDGRDVILTYPCNKHEGANVTFLLLLHGTNANEATKAYIHGYFAAHTLTNSHNLIVATPKSRASQWGNTTENPQASEDKPHLLNVIDYVYKNLATKFHITSMWVGGHSWGAMYAKRFVCDSTIQDKVRGVIGMSGGSTAPGGRSFGSSGSDLTPTMNCADYISQVHTVGDMDSVMGVPDQTAPATKHGCMAKTPAMDLGSMQMVEEWPKCSPGWLHENITMGGHTHTTSVNPDVVKHVMDKVKATEKR